MKPKKNILLIGYGNLGSNLSVAWKDKFNLTFLEKDPKKIVILKKKNIEVFSLKKIKNFDFLVLCVKPKNLKEIGKILSNNLVRNKTIISFMAGIEIKKIQNLVDPSNLICRVMPNLFSGLGMGVNAIFLEQASKEKQKSIQNLIMSLGKIVWLKKESDLDFFTAFYGGAPAYFFLFLDILQKIILGRKFYSEDSRSYIIQTLEGTLKFLKQNENNFEQYISLVASKGGTTEEALKILNKDKALFKLFNYAMRKASRKSEILRKKN